MYFENKSSLAPLIFARPVNSNMEDAHAEISIIQQAFRGGKTQDQDMTMKVSRQVCGICFGDIPKEAERAGLKSLTIVARNRDGETQEAKPYFYYRWTRGMRRLEEVQAPDGK